MAAATYTTNFSPLVADSSNTNNWQATGGGQAGLNVETDYFIQGTRCISKNAWAGAEKGMIEDTTNNLLSSGSGNAVYMWITHHTPGSLATKANGGINICLGSSGSVYNEYDYAGSDTIDYGAPWICAVVDPDNATPSAGSVTVANMDCYGAQANLPVGGPTKGSPFGIDEIRYGRSLLINDGVGTPATFTEVASNNDNINNRWGMFQRTPGSTTNFTMQCRMQFGNAAKCEFSDSNKNITINDLEHVASSFIEFDVTQASDISLTNINIVATSGGNTKGNWVTTSAGTCSFTTCNFTNMGTFGLSSGYTITGCTFRGCGTVTLNTASLVNCVFDKPDVTGGSAVIAVPTDSIDSCSFTRDTTKTQHAIDLGTVNTTTFSWNSTATDYAADDGPTGNEVIRVTVNSGQVLTINYSGTAPSVKNDGTGTITKSSSVSFDLLNLVAGSTIYVEARSGGTLTAGDIMVGAQIVAGTSFSTTLVGGQPFRLVVANASGSPVYVPEIIDDTTGTGFSRTFDQQLDE